MFYSMRCHWDKGEDLSHGDFLKSFENFWFRLGINEG